MGGRRVPRGQHFLSDTAVARRIVDLSGVGPGDTVLEIGPGKGILTRILASRVKRVIAVEIEDALARGLRAAFPENPCVEIIHADAMSFDLGTVPRGTRVVANLPYYISTPLIRKFLEARDRLPLLVLMVQREVAERIAAGPGTKEYGVLSVSVQLYADQELAFIVPPGCFSPPPRVQSAVIRLVTRDTPRVDLGPGSAFQDIVNASFMLRRKTLLNSLSHGLHLSRDAVADALSRCGIDPRRRPETLSLGEFSLLARDHGLFRPPAVAPSGGG